MDKYSTNGEKKKTINNIIEDFSLATSFSAVLCDIQGKEVSSTFNFSSFCQLMRKNPKFHELCRKCDKFGGLEAYKTGNASIYRCHAGLTDISLPIITENQLTGFILFGQVEVIDNEISIHPIDTENTDWTKNLELCKAREKIPQVSIEKVHSSISLLQTIGEYYSKDEAREKIKFTAKKKTVNSNHESIQKVTNYIEKNITRKITLNEVADHVYFSPHYLSKLFKKELGSNFISYVNEQKMKQAQALLIETNFTIEQIARNLGYSQTSYFCKIFHDITNDTPTQFRNKYKN
ncbi:Ligand-binding sensor domain-containing protein [Pilibacter termitis]|uniref:Ligand-binding sensor domain-containing protein n=1 Tax=Pilibacter termitis TaxID=263852 RepID=A0A1T4ML74_9ENTE|nr:PocR ligand-binding domain-containing protein [Pilibacter termitis]SJZ67565.1 Ligand-binding sensor domain-containing protein [Pilibacter termitis]